MSRGIVSFYDRYPYDEWPSVGDTEYSEIRICGDCHYGNHKACRGDCDCTGVGHG